MNTVYLSHPIKVKGEYRCTATLTRGQNDLVRQYDLIEIPSPGQTVHLRELKAIEAHLGVRILAPNGVRPGVHYPVRTL